MYYTGIDPRDMTPVFAETTPHGKELQRALLQWFRPDKKKLVIEALKKAGREDLIGYGPKCLVRPYGDDRAMPHGKSGPSQSPRQKAKRDKKCLQSDRFASIFLLPLLYSLARRQKKAHGFAKFHGLFDEMNQYPLTDNHSAGTST